MFFLFYFYLNIFYLNIFLYNYKKRREFSYSGIVKRNRIEKKKRKGKKRNYPRESHSILRGLSFTKRLSTSRKRDHLDEKIPREEFLRTIPRRQWRGKKWVGKRMI